MQIKGTNENQTAYLYFGTPHPDGGRPNKAAIICQGISNFSRSRMHFCLDNTASNDGSYIASVSNAKMTITPDGFVGIGTTSPSYALQLSSDSAAKPSTNTWTVSSDSRLKTNITQANLDTCYNTIKSIPLKRYTWRDDIYTTEQVPDRSKLGWIAQDVEQVIPKAVEQKEMHGYSDCRTLNSDQLIASLYGAVQKLIQDFENEKEEHNTTKQTLDNLKSELQNKFIGEFN